MPLEETQQSQPDVEAGLPTIPCDACASALRSPGRETTVFLLIDGLTVSLVGCSEHLEQFRAICGHTTQQTVDLLGHPPAGGIPCPGCRLAPQDPNQPIVPIGNGAIVVLGCSRHRSETIDRFYTGLETRRQITSSLPSSAE